MLNFTAAPTLEVFVSQMRVSIVVPYLDFWLSRVFINRQLPSFTLPTGISDWGFEVSSPKIWSSPWGIGWPIWSTYFTYDQESTPLLIKLSQPSYSIYYIWLGVTRRVHLVNAPLALIGVHVALFLFSMFGIFVNSVCSCLLFGFPMILSLSTVLLYLITSRYRSTTRQLFHSEQCYWWLEPYNPKLEHQQPFIGKCQN